MSSQAFNQQIPPDIIREILKTFSTRLVLDSSGSASAFPWYLGHICSTWRDVFLSMYHEFWGQFHLLDCPSGLHVYCLSPEAEERCVDITKHFLACGGRVPLSFHLGHNWRRLALLLFKLFIPESERWQDASFVADGARITLLLAVKNRIPLLRSLVLVAEGRIGEEVWDVDITDLGCGYIFQGAPNLIQVRLRRLSLWAFDWSSLAIFELTHALPYGLLNVLSQMENLEKLLIDQPDDDIQLAASAEITLPRLRVLAISGYMTDILSVLQVPQLEALYINTINRDWDEPYDACATFFQQAVRRLKRVSVTTYDAHFVQYILQHTPEINVLDVMAPDEVFGEIFQLLTYSEDNISLVPGLQRLHMYYSHPPEPNELEAMKSMMASRKMDHDQRFKSLCMTLSSDSHTAPRLEHLCQGYGVRYSIKGFPPDTDYAQSFLRKDID